MNYRLALLAAVLVLGSAAAPVRAAAIPPPPGSFTIVLLPDTQVYAQSYPHIYDAQTQWIKDHRDSHNIQCVLHLGDITNNNNTVQWDNAKAAMSILDGFVPYAMAPGNHDYGSNGSASDRSTMFNLDTYFGPGSAYTEQATFGGVYEAGKTDNSYHTFNAGGTDWLVLALEFGPRDDVVTWANQVVASHLDHKAILVTHAYMYYTEVRYDWATYGSAQSWNPHAYGVASLPGGVNDGQELWDGLVSQYENFAFTFNGHVLADGTGYLGSLGTHGNVVHQMLANYQMDAYGGNGYMRLLEFLPDGETVQVRTYSPVTDAYNDDFDQQFTLNLNEIHPPLVPPPPPVYYHAIGGNVVVTGPVDPSTNTVDAVAVPQSALPGVSTLKVNRGDYQIAVDGDGLHYQHGVLLASVTENVRDGIRATVEVGRNSFSDGLLSLSVTEAGNSSCNEVNVNTSVAWFMFDAGWQGAHVNGSGTIAAANAVDQSMVTRTGTGRYRLDLGASTTASDGMLFAIANNNDNTVVHTRVLPDGTWDLRVQDNGATMVGEDADFSFLYLPFDTENLLGGLYDGESDIHVTSSGDFDMLRLGTGQYQLTLPGETPETGMLILTVADDFAGAPDDNFLTYQADGLGNFLIETRDLPFCGLEDTEFVWAFISFTDPIQILGPIASEWAGADAGLYHDPEMWDDGVVPEGGGATANFLQKITSPSTVTVESPLTVGTIVFKEDNPANGYTLEGAPITVQAIDVVQGDHVITNQLSSAAVAISTEADASLTLAQAGFVDANITKTGAGTLNLPVGMAFRGDLTAEQGVVNAGEDVLAIASPRTISLGASTVLNASGHVNGFVVDTGGLTSPSTLNAVGPMTVGVLGSTDGYNYGGILNADTHPVVLLDFDKADVGLALIGGGSLTGAKGIQLNPATVGFGGFITGSGEIHGVVTAGTPGNPAMGFGGVAPGITVYGDVIGLWNQFDNTTVTGMLHAGFSPAHNPLGPGSNAGTAQFLIGGPLDGEVTFNSATGEYEKTTGDHTQFLVYGVAEGQPAGAPTVFESLELKLDEDYPDFGWDDLAAGDDIVLIQTAPWQTVQFITLPFPHYETTLVEPGLVDYGTSFEGDLQSALDLIRPKLGTGLDVTYTMNPDGLALHIVPEPGTLALLLSSGLALLAYAWRRRRAR